MLKLQSFYVFLKRNSYLYFLKNVFGLQSIGKRIFVETKVMPQMMK
jgi:hypothetical protein